MDTRCPTVTREALEPDHPEPFDGVHPVANRRRIRSRPRPVADGADERGRRRRPRPARPPARPARTQAGTSGLIGEGRYDEAYAVAAEVNPFPSVCGWICTAPCEAACRRGTLDEPIAIRTLKRFAAEHGKLPPIAAPATQRTERVAIVGGGPAGMSAAYYLARLGYPVTVFEAMPVPGGMMAIGIPEYRLPREALRAEIDRIVGLGVELRLDSRHGPRLHAGRSRGAGLPAIFLATGASRSRRLGVPGDDLAGRRPGDPVPEARSTSARSLDWAAVVVVGGGSTAMDAARSALRSGATSVTVSTAAAEPICRRSPRRSRRPSARASWSSATVVEEVLGDRRSARSASRASSRPAATRVADRPTSRCRTPSTSWPHQTVLVAVGEEPDPSILPEGAGIEVSAFAGIAADRRTLATGRAGVFAGGDVGRAQDHHRRGGRRTPGGRVRPRVPGGRRGRRGARSWPSSGIAPRSRRS